MPTTRWPRHIGALVSRTACHFLTRPGLGPYAATRAELLQRAGDVFDWVRSGKLKLRIFQTLPLKDAAEAHRLLEGRKAVGKVLLIP